MSPARSPTRRWTMDADGDFVVAWQSGTPQDGRRLGVCRPTLQSARELRRARRVPGQHLHLGRAGHSRWWRSDCRATSSSPGRAPVRTATSAGSSGSPCFNAAGTALAAEFHGQHTYTAAIQAEPAISTAAGGAFVVGRGGLTENADVFARFASSAADPRRASRSSQLRPVGRPAGAPAVAMDARRRLRGRLARQLVRTDQATESSPARFASRRHAPQATSSRPTHPPSGDQAVPHGRGRAADGDFVVVVGEQQARTARSHGVFARRFDACGRAVRRRVPRQHLHHRATRRLAGGGSGRGRQLRRCLAERVSRTDGP